ncbi:fibroblast growth factor receptor 3-like [Hydractinia symbiolongicarpus]|uniref:fibroblast growth factor receptor 3-like n=1 Tax=Hydractinia symbiolongicarpus TaxID=13093 RepID=UPI00254C33F8|nr:fibroblast growth factor receptor 3-like [Hydractinia symbiolongicarpus]
MCLQKLTIIMMFSLLKTGFLIYSGEQIRLVCKYRNNTEKVVWLKNNKSINFKDQRYILKKAGRILRIINVNKDDIGVYSCNDVTTGKSVKEIIAYNVTIVEGEKLHFSNPKEMHLSSHTVSPSGAQVTFSCKADGDKPITYKWFINHKLMLSGEWREALIDDQSVLQLNSVFSSDSAVYTCRAENKHGFIEFNYTLNVYGIPRATPHLERTVENQTRYVGENASISCYTVTVHTESIHFGWLKWKSSLNKTFLRKVKHLRTNDIEYNEFKLLNSTLVKRTTNAMRSNMERVTFFGSKITLVNVKLNDAGYYTCLVSNHLGSDSVSAYLNVLPTRSATELDKSATTFSSFFIVIIVLSIVICVSLFILIKLWIKARKQGNNVVVERVHAEENDYVRTDELSTLFSESRT